MTKDIEKLTKVLHHTAIRELDDYELIDKYFGILMEITNGLKEALEMSDEKLKYDRMDWINRGSEAGWWESPMEYERDSDFTTLSILMAQMLRYNRLIKKEAREAHCCTTGCISCTSTCN